MARRGRPKRVPKSDEDGTPIHLHDLKVKVEPDVLRFLTRETKRIGARNKRDYCPADIVKALIAAYYEKRALGLLVDPDD